ncbi:DNA polymerase III epsilon subunit [hydrothermal vent metagenome]|uniref:DNA polymerase III epsilon subunit n=1 Tax=hydrothermal vent metagenome TaxID=652676 RepID=A0A1W1CCI8_9ZZZZ
MQKVFEALTEAFRVYEGVLNAKQYISIIDEHSSFLEDSDMILILLQASGYPIIQEDEDKYILETYFTCHRQQRYCVIDIETNGSKPNTSQVIEIGALMWQNGKILASYETFVECVFLPDYISKITGITHADLVDAPSRKEALIGLRHFMGDAIFVAHNVKFDYGFLNASFERFGLGNIGNPKLCTIELAQRTFESERYGLAYLIEFLEIETATHHRAYSDALCASKVMEKSLETIPTYVSTADELLRFAVSSRKERRLKKED